ncbi:acyltransferase family protein [Allonocardiopsis opalescens]|uniref:Fucose 4-O-acetylase-like acetyltransferase n=1 Tax=Allonocardiopsis opalescens TaxID=1144618 RepID=A0A2T0Q8C8_9ACTN|nr:acyltransferase family protein [Allonocardiopsis opalescens]PRY00067.1 fucose 4-O-acetylase-like acetyltransferase [Allonocardiopsis opalescens]
MIDPHPHPHPHPHPRTGHPPAPAPTTPEAAPPRLHYLDKLRVLLTVLVIAHHAALTYSGLPVWYYTEVPADGSGPVMLMLMGYTQSFFMGAFFLVAGFFVPGAADRKGGRRFWRDRLVRLGIPVLFFLLLLRPLVNFHGYDTFAGYAAEAGLPELPYWMYYLFTWDPGPLWFAELLLVFSLGYLLVRRFTARRRTTGAVSEARPAASHRVPGPIDVAVFTAGLIAVTYLWRILVPTGSYLPFVALPSPSFLPQYTALFVVGVYAYRRDWTRGLTARAGWVGLAAALAAGLVLRPVTLGFAEGRGFGHGTWESLVVATWESVYAVGITIALLVLMKARFNRRGRFGDFLADHAYTVYITHPLVMVALGFALSAAELPGLVKFAALALLSVPLCWGLAYGVRALPYAKRVL